MATSFLQVLLKLQSIGIIVLGLSFQSIKAGLNNIVFDILDYCMPVQTPPSDSVVIVKDVIESVPRADFCFMAPEVIADQRISF